MMGKSHRFSRGHSSGLVPEYRHAVDNMGESEGLGSSGRVDSEDACVPKRKITSLDIDRSVFGDIPVIHIPLSTMSLEDKRDRETMLQAELEQIQKLWKKISETIIDEVYVSPSTGGQGMKRAPAVQTPQLKVKRNIDEAYISPSTGGQRVKRAPAVQTPQLKGKRKRIIDEVYVSPSTGGQRVKRAPAVQTPQLKGKRKRIIDEVYVSPSTGGQRVKRAPAVQTPQLKGKRKRIIDEVYVSPSPGGQRVKRTPAVQTPQLKRKMIIDEAYLSPSTGGQGVKCSPVVQTPQLKRGNPGRSASKKQIPSANGSVRSSGRESNVPTTGSVTFSPPMNNVRQQQITGVKSTLDQEKTDIMNIVDINLTLEVSDPTEDNTEHLKAVSFGDDCRGDGTSTSEMQVSSERHLRYAMLMDRFGDTIKRVQKNGLAKSGISDPELLRREGEKLKRQQREDTIRLQAAATAAEAGHKKLLNLLKQNEADESRRRRELEREAARQALLKMERTVEIGNSQFLKELQMFATTPPTEHFPSYLLEKLGLFLKKDYDEESDVEEGEIKL